MWFQGTRFTVTHARVSAKCDLCLHFMKVLNVIMLINGFIWQPADVMAKAAFKHTKYFIIAVIP